MRRLFALMIGLGFAIPAAASMPLASMAADAGTQVKARTDAASRAASSAAGNVQTQTEAAAQRSERHGISRWVWVALAVIVVLLLIAALWGRRRRQAVIRSRIG